MNDHQNYVAQAIAACPFSNQIMAQGFEAVSTGGHLQWSKEVAPKVWAVISDEGLGLGNHHSAMGVFLISYDREESRIWHSDKPPSVEQCLRWTAWAERKLKH